MTHTTEFNKDTPLSQKPVIEFDIDNNEFDIDTDDFTFKPITSGLGFNQEREKRIFKNTATPKAKAESAPAQGTMSAKVYDASKYLDVFEKKLETKEVKETLFKEEEEASFEIASKRLQVSAWLIDVLVIFALMSLTLMFSAITPGMGMNDFLKLISFKDMVTFSLIMFACYYVLYFTIMDFFISPGKYLLNIRLIRTNDQPLSLVDTFLRSVVSIASFSALCLPIYMDFHGKISDTKVIYKSNY